MQTQGDQNMELLSNVQKRIWFSTFFIIETFLTPTALANKTANQETGQTPTEDSSDASRQAGIAFIVIFATGVFLCALYAFLKYLRKRRLEGGIKKPAPEEVDFQEGYQFERVDDPHGGGKLELEDIHEEQFGFKRARGSVIDVDFQAAIKMSNRKFASERPVIKEDDDNIFERDPQAKMDLEAMNHNIDLDFESSSSSSSSSSGDDNKTDTNPDIVTSSDKKEEDTVDGKEWQGEGDSFGETKGNPNDETRA
mmetsp:Transcript_2239/g.2324  ORF Transcript_2239/g.2324 Transcript_2239/m.2324 type:complete len:253 (-) Transcript_2239:400-1158(-)